MRTPRHPERGGFKLFLLVLFTTVLAGGVVLFIWFTGTKPFSREFIEQESPSITWLEEPSGVGADPVPVKLQVHDTGAGLDDVIVRLSQKNQPITLYRLSNHSQGGARPASTEPLELQVVIDAQKLGLHEGVAELQVLAFDRTLWSNGSSVTKNIQVDFLKPQIEPLTPQQNGVEGGSEMVFYKVQSRSNPRSGVEGAGMLYAGCPASVWNDAFRAHKQVFFALFPVPLRAKEEQKRLTIVARDAIGNSASAPFRYAVRARRATTVQVSLGLDLLSTVRERLLNSAKRLNRVPTLNGEVGSDLRVLLKDLARYDEGVLGDALHTSQPTRWWSGTFGRPVPAAPSNSFGDLRTITLPTGEEVKNLTQGLRFAVNSRTSVVAAQAGHVQLVASLGTLGETVVLDHGCGIASVYGHLSRVGVTQGQQVTKGESLGETGTSGFATSEEVYFEVRLHGVAVSPHEWLDETWVREHIENKVAAVQRSLLGGGAE
jgi:murein DD-endopeptidase MepM/ murein hydrolase activator NlpD